MFFIWLHWHFIEVPQFLLKAWKNFLWFNINYFSVPQLLKTFFSHWRGIVEHYGRSFDPKRYLDVFFGNFISRFLGALVRAGVILITLVFELFIFILGILILLIWLFLPFLILILILGGITFL